MENINQNNFSNVPLIPEHENTIAGEAVPDTKLTHANVLEIGKVIPEEKVEVELTTTLKPADMPVMERARETAASLDEKQEVVSSFSQTKARTLIKILKNLQISIDAALRLLESDEKTTQILATHVVANVREALAETAKIDTEATALADQKIVEGVFDGEHMVGAHGETYTVPPNYASKSKLVEGDMLKLTISQTGAFLYKQIGPIERDRLVGMLFQNKETGEYGVSVGDKTYRVLKASITYFKGEEGDEVVLLVPKNAASYFAAVENIVKKRV